MSSQKYIKPELQNPDYVPVIKDADTFYGGSQMWFSSNRKLSKDYLIYNYGCGTIATADLFLYLALQNNRFRGPETEIAFRGSNLIYYENYAAYIRTINSQYTKTKRYLAVFGTKIAKVINDYSDSYDFGFHASWKSGLNYYDMLNVMEDMLQKDFPVILSIGPNTPKLWGDKGISFYTIREIPYYAENKKAEKKATSVSEPVVPIEQDPTTRQETSNSSSPQNTSSKNPYYYKPAVTDVNGHYVTVTGVIKDDITNRILLRISSWGKQYYINYEEYRDYIETYGDTFTSNIVRIKRK